MTIYLSFYGYLRKNSNEKDKKDLGFLVFPLGVGDVGKDFIFPKKITKKLWAALGRKLISLFRLKFFSVHSRCDKEKQNSPVTWEEELVIGVISFSPNLSPLIIVTLILVPFA